MNVPPDPIEVTVDLRATHRHPVGTDGARPRVTDGELAGRLVLRLSVAALEASDDPDLTELVQLVDRVTRRRGVEDAEVVVLRAQDLCVVADRLGLDPAALPPWLAERGVLAPG